MKANTRSTLLALGVLACGIILCALCSCQKEYCYECTTTNYHRSTERPAWRKLSTTVGIECGEESIEGVRMIHVTDSDSTVVTCVLLN